ncbi:hypothetical protein OC834_001828 [Tilletia horrida]|nr:hypothetical protein OC835_002741 [Tilletia horrida]KAK0534572.1 hypothetical protein OC834_001828 [Tilletia horrida]
MAGSRKQATSANANANANAATTSTTKAFEALSIKQEAGNFKSAESQVKKGDKTGDDYEDDDDESEEDDDDYDEDEDEDFVPDASQDEADDEDNDRAAVNEVKSELAGLTSDRKDGNVYVHARAALAKVNGKDLYAYYDAPYEPHYGAKVEVKDEAEQDGDAAMS